MDLLFYIITVFIIVFFATLFVENIYHPFKTRRQLRNHTFNSDTTEFDRARSEVVLKQQKVTKEKSLEKQQKEEEKYLQKLEKLQKEHEKKYGHSGYTLGKLEEESKSPKSERTKLIEDQDREFQASLLKDQQKELLKQRRMEREQKKKQLRLKLEETHPEPDKSSTEVFQIQFRFPDSSKITRRFYSDTKVETLLDFAFANGKMDKERDELQLVTPYPRTVLSDLNATLSSYSFPPQVVLIVEEI